ncbi:MAG: NAD-dependent epimerase/dehydratase family protein [Candidatus Paceibacterota bacterium]|jgi:nucleoside-diphosphate-sugar epimerase
MKLFITGGSGYVGTMLADQFAGRSDVDAILLLDKESYPELLEAHPQKDKITFIQANLGDNDWQERVKVFAPDVIIHTAWQIREMYGKKDLQWKWNITGSDNVFDLAFSLPSVKKLIYFSTVSSYAAYPTNTIDHFFTETEGFRKSDYLYAEEKRFAEEHLKAKYEEAKKQKESGEGNIPQVFIVRPAALTGPRGRYMRVRFGLQSALSGQLKQNLLHRLISLMVSFVPVTPKWLRQYIHEDDVCNIVEMFTFTPVKGDYEIFNICPPGEAVLGPDMARAVNKKAILVFPWMVRIVFFIFWHLSRGKVPTSKGGWKSYSYPIAVDGSRLTRKTGYIYLYPSKDAFVKKEGRYAKYIK